MHTPYAARFKLFTMCANCLRNGTTVLCVPAVDDAPTSVDELVGSAFLQRASFACHACDSAIGEITGIDELPLEDDVSEQERMAA